MVAVVPWQFQLPVRLPNCYNFNVAIGRHCGGWQRDGGGGDDHWLRYNGTTLAKLCAAPATRCRRHRLRRQVV